MGSGSLPVYGAHETGLKLIEAIRLIAEVRDYWRDAVYSGESGGNQFDNAARDGAYLERLNVAMEMLKAVVR